MFSENRLYDGRGCWSEIHLSNVCERQAELPVLLERLDHVLVAERFLVELRAQAGHQAGGAHRLERNRFFNQEVGHEGRHESVFRDQGLVEPAEALVPQVDLVLEESRGLPLLPAVDEAGLKHGRV